MISEHNTRYAILNIAKTPEEAQEMVEYLSSLDWHQIYLEQEQRRSRAEVERKAKLQIIIKNGGGHCERCDSLRDTLFSFPHNDYIVTRHKAKYKYNGKYCIECINRLEKSFDVPVDDWSRMCERCNILFPTRDYQSHKKVEGRWYGYCPSCFHILLEASKITCIGCGEHTLDYTYSPICDNCYVVYPDWQIVSRHLKRAREAGTAATLTLAQWKATVNHFNSKCAYCLKKKYQVLEHYLPISISGGTTFDNCVPACKYCNNRKSDTHPDQLDGIFPAENLARIRQYLSEQSA